MVTAKAPKTKKPKKSNPTAALTRAEGVANENLVAALDQIKAELRELAEDDIKRRWQLGCKVHAIMTDDTGTYGTDPAAIVKAMLPLSRDSLRPMVQMAERYEEYEIDELTSLRHPKTAEGLTWSHIIALSRVKDKSKAKNLAEKAVSSGWSTKELVAEVIRSSGGPKSSGGRKAKKPTSLSAALGDIVNRSVSWINAAKDSWLAEGGLADLMKDVNPTADTVNMLDQAIASVEAVTAAVAAVSRQLGVMHIQSKAALVDKRVA